MMKYFLIVGIGSFFGGGFRFLVQQYLTEKAGNGFPFGTLVVNIAGSFILGMLFALANKTNLISNELRLLLATGFCGGFTTFSTFSLENINMLRDGQIFNVFLYTGVSIFFGFFATYLAIQLFK